MSISIEKIKTARKKKEGTTRKSEIERAMMQLRRMRKESREQSQSRLGVVIQNGLLLVQVKPSPGAPAEGNKAPAKFSLSNSRIARKRKPNEGNKQLRIMMENAHGDRDRMLHTLSETTSTEAMAFYNSLRKR